MKFRERDEAEDKYFFQLKPKKLQANISLIYPSLLVSMMPPSKVTESLLKFSSGKRPRNPRMKSVGVINFSPLTSWEAYCDVKKR
jgi:hypothetical protein